MGLLQNRRLLIGCLVAALGSLMGRAQSSPNAGNGDVGKIIAQLNAASAKFRSAQAEFSWDSYQAVVQDHDIQTGTIYFERANGATRMAAQVKEDDGKPAPKFIVYNGSEVQFYQPAIKQMTIFRTGSNREQTESFFTLGFGGSGTELEGNWDVTFQGKEQMNGVEVAKLDLIPKAQNVKNTFTHATIWVDLARGISLKQIFYSPSGDLRTAIYSNIRYNQPVPADVFHIKTAPGTSIQTK